MNFKHTTQLEESSINDGLITTEDASFAKVGRIALAGILAVTPASLPLTAFALVDNASQESTGDSTTSLTVTDLTYVDPCKGQLDAAQAEFDRIAAWFEPIDAEYRNDTAIKDAAVQKHAAAASAATAAEREARGYISGVILDSQEDLRRAEALLADAKAECARLQTALEAAKQTQDDAKNKVDSAEQAWKDAQTANGGVTEDTVKAAKDAVDAARKGYNDAVAAIAAAETAQAEAQVNYDAAVAAVAAAQAALEKAKADAIDALASRSTAQTAYDQAKAKLDELKEEAEAGSGEARDKVDQAKAELAAAESKRNAAAAEQGTAQSDYDAATSDVDTAQAAVDAAQAALDEARNAETQARINLPIAEKRASDLNQQVVALGEQINEYIANRNAATDQETYEYWNNLVLTESNNLRILSGERDAAWNTVDALQVTIEAAPEKIAQAEANMQAPQEELGRVQQIQSEKLATLNEKKSITEAAQAEVDAAQEALDAAERELAAATPGLEEAQKAVDDAKGVLDHWNAQVASTNAAQDNAQTTFDQKQATASTVHVVLEKAEADTEAKKQKATDAQQNLKRKEQDHQDQINAYATVLAAQKTYEAAAQQHASAVASYNAAVERCTAANTAVNEAESNKRIAEQNEIDIRNLNLDYETIYLELISGTDQQSARRASVRSISPVNTAFIQQRSKSLVQNVINTQTTRNAAKAELDEALVIYGQKSAEYAQKKAVYDQAAENLTLAQAFYDAAVARQQAEELAAQRNNRSLGTPLAQTGDDMPRSIGVLTTLGIAAAFTARFGLRKRKSSR